MTNIVLLSAWLLTNTISEGMNTCVNSNCIEYCSFVAESKTNSYLKYAVHGHWIKHTSVVRVSVIGFQQGTNSIPIGTNWVLLRKEVK